LRTLLRVFAFAKKSTRLFSIDSALFAKKTGGGVSRFAESAAPAKMPQRNLSRPCLLISLRPYFLTSRNGDALPAAMELLRKGRTVFRREDRVDRFAVT
jgi:hypothetical protein